ncbi:MAG: copper resistance protein B, partial [Pseudomonadota bacterium]
MKSSLFIAVGLTALILPSAAFAQHAGHEGHGQSTETASPAPVNEDDPHAGHGSMDHSGMDKDVSPGPLSETPAPPEAGSGPPRAADKIWGADVMAHARHKEHGKHGNFPVLWVQADRFEAQLRQGSDGFLWDLQGYYGNPTSKLWLKSEGEGEFGEGVEDAEIQALWSKAVDPFWDLQLGIRQDVAGPSTTHAVVGFQGLAPYMFEVDAALFLSHRGDVTARIEGELEQRITQRLILQPRAELVLSAQDVPQLDIGSGIDKVEFGVRLRYEITREFAPYVGIEQTWHVGNGAD